MSIKLTPAGEQAYEWMDWAYDDLTGRLEQARTQVRGIYAGLNPGQSKNEVSDVLTQLSRLGDDTVTMAAPDTISEQLEPRDEIQ